MQIWKPKQEERNPQTREIIGCVTFIPDPLFFDERSSIEVKLWRRGPGPPADLAWTRNLEMMYYLFIVSRPLNFSLGFSGTRSISLLRIKYQKETLTTKSLFNMSRTRQAAMTLPGTYDPHYNQESPLISVPAQSHLLVGGCAIA